MTVEGRFENFSKYYKGLLLHRS